jgi:hypothetical protein
MVAIVIGNLRQKWVANKLCLSSCSSQLSDPDATLSPRGIRRASMTVLALVSAVFMDLTASQVIIAS